jgi:hypothetical protein
MLSQPINSFILKSQYQVKQGTHMNKKLNINLVQHLWLDLNQERIDQVLSLCIEYLWNQLDHIKKVFKEWKTWSDMWDKILVEEGLTRIWPRWTIHQRRASGSLGIKEPYVMEKGKWTFNLRNQAYYEESYITNSQSLLNQEIKWLGYQKWKLIIRCEVLQVTTSKSQCLNKIKYDNPQEVKKRWSDKIQYGASSS